MLLVVALIATIFGWRAAVEQERRANRDGERVGLQLQLGYRENELARYEDSLQNGEPGAASMIQNVKVSIDYLKHQIDELLK
jgi:hypothetical protein